MYTKKEREQYNHSREIVCKDLGITVNQYNWFRRKGAELNRIYTDNCNGFYENEDEYEKISAEVETKVSKRVNDLELFVYFQTDPRGATIYLSKKPIESNDYNRSGSHCIY